MPFNVQFKDYDYLISEHCKEPTAKYSAKHMHLIHDINFKLFDDCDTLEEVRENMRLLEEVYGEIFQINCEDL